MLSLPCGLTASSCVPHHFVFVTLEADDAAPVAAAVVRTGLSAGVLQLQDAPVHRGTGLHLPQTLVRVSDLPTGRGAGGTLP